MAKVDKKALGSLGEAEALRYLKGEGYCILQKNYACKHGEADIVCQDVSGVLVFAEVKTRKTLNFGSPSEAVGKSKQSKLVKTAMEYIKTYTTHLPEIRFDVIGVTMGLDIDINHIKSAFIVD